MFKKILLAASPAVNTQTAPKAAFDLARRNDAELILYHSLPIGKDAWCTFDETIPEETLKQATADKIAAFYAEDLATIPKHSIKVTTGLAHEKLLRYIHAEGVDLVVMGHHTATIDRPDRMWGSVDTTIRKICSNVFCPVMVVTNAMQENADIKRIVVATDFSTPSDSTLCYAAQMARKYDAHLDIFHVLDIGVTRPNPKYYMQDMDVFTGQAKERMTRFDKALTGISHSYECWEGIPYVEILKRARWTDADLIIMAQYSSSQEISKPMIGSTVIQVALSPGCPALIVNYRARHCM
ncbi:universal stress protein [Pseudodesulfovibrio cashew]|uniref:Universal stress protein n=1 Tax=Pseudodesulfovibrio cashew TaxID=2678688 RepID=A0A6I6JJ58_9BACT|nr:universal stress protein [Pseudodesulfovibrio cashew]QGY40413.1 universal stress protein [Pseudodesulfovibrio cashew]